MSTYIRKNALEFHIDLRNVRDERTFLMKMKESFSFPDYFGYTLDCLDDCMQSLDWIDHSQVLAKFYHLDDVRKHNETLYGEIVSSLELYRSYWNGNPEKKVQFEY
nr:barstar family protein [uncultured Capnocytophaga sp.]